MKKYAVVNGAYFLQEWVSGEMNTVHYCSDCAKFLKCFSRTRCHTELKISERRSFSASASEQKIECELPKIELFINEWKLSTKKRDERRLKERKVSVAHFYESVIKFS